MMNDQNEYTCSVTMEIVLKIFSETRKEVQLCHINVCSLNRPKIDYFNYLLHALLIGIVCITAAWFRFHSERKFCQVRSFNVFRHDRTYKDKDDGTTVHIT